MQTAPGAPPEHRWLFRWTRRFLLGGAGLFSFLVIAGLIYQVAGQWQDAKRYPAPGTLVEVGGHRMHLYATGAGTIPVVLEAGNGGGVLDWYQVQPRVAKFTQVVSYDRAGAGWSEVGPEPRTAARIVEELHTLLSKAGIRPPYVLVGHSLGGLNMQLYAMRYPEEVAGLVLVDSCHVDLADHKELEPRAFCMPTLVRVVAALGTVRFLNTVNDRRNLRIPPNERPPGFVPELEQERSAIYSHTGNLVTMSRELVSLPVSAAQVRAARLQMGDKPLFVLTQAERKNPTPERVALETLWKGWQADLAGRSRNSRHEFAEHAGHYIHMEEPERVVTAIERTVMAARTKTGI